MINKMKVLKARHDLIQAYNNLLDIQEDLALEAISFEALEDYALDLEEAIEAIFNVIKQLREVDDE